MLAAVQTGSTNKVQQGVVMRQRIFAGIILSLLNLQSSAASFTTFIPTAQIYNSRLPFGVSADGSIAFGYAIGSGNDCGFCPHQTRHA